MRSIRNSAKAVILWDGKLAVIRISDGREEWYILPGGGQATEETLPQAVEREAAEETGLRVRCGELLFVIEGVHGEAHHRVDLVFACELLGEADGPRTLDTNQVGVAWVDVADLNRLPLYPSKLRRPIMNYAEGKPFLTYLGNEEIGDPECLD